MTAVVPADGFPEQFGAAVQIKLFFHAGAIGLHRFQADAQRYGDLAGAQSPAQHVEDLQFAVAQLLDGGTVGPLIVIYKISGEQAGQVFADVKFALQNAADGFDDLAVVSRFIT